jgi:hypothetical protein
VVIDAQFSFPKPSIKSTNSNPSPAFINATNLIYLFHY